MNPQVTAAWIAAGLSAATLIGTLLTAYLNRKQLDRTLGEQRTRTLNERFAMAAGQLGDDKPTAVRLAGVYAMAGLADDWPENRQTCVDVLCAYLRMPYELDPGEDAPEPQRLAFQAIREVRHTVIRVITAHLKDNAAVSWERLNFDFTGVVFDGGDFSGAVFSGTVSFSGARFPGEVSFSGAEFSGGEVSFHLAKFSGGEVSFNYAKFSGGEVNFAAAEFSSGKVTFHGAKFSGGEVSFFGAKFSGSTVDFGWAEFSGGEVTFHGAKFSGGEVSFNYAKFSGGEVYFSAEFSGGEVSFRGAKFSGGEVSFRGAKFSGGEVYFSAPRDWSVPPAFPWTGTPPPGVELPKKEDPRLA